MGWFQLTGKMRGGLRTALVLLLVWGSGGGNAFAAEAAGPAAEAAASTENTAGERKLDDPEGILNLDIDQLSKVNVVAPSLNLEVSTVERTQSTVGRTPAAVFVITSEMIQRSGVRTIPDALRLAPGVEVQRKFGSEWAIGIRGFDEIYSDKLLVQVDGRSVYTPLFGGVCWDTVDVPLEEIERIEVIRGPGGTLWGANAVSGVINIISKNSKETQGGYFEGVAGTEERGSTTARYGGQLSDNATYRFYGKWFDRDGGYIPGVEPSDDWRQSRTGFRIDWDAARDDKCTLQGDYYDGYNGSAGEIPSPSPPFTSSYVQDTHVSGGNVLTRWTHTIDKDTDWSLQWYYDRAERHGQALPVVWDYETIDLDFQYRLPLNEDHALIWGAGYRNYSDYTRGVSYLIEYEPAKASLDTFSCFAQDQMTLREDVLYLIGGSKFENNDYSGFEIQPTLRLLWTPTEKRCLWTAVSRAVQTPNRLEEDIINTQTPSIGSGGVPVFPVILGSTGVESAEVIAYEAGMRAQPTKRFYWDLATFYNDYQKMLGFQRGTPYGTTTPTGYPAVIYPLTSVSVVPGETYGFELAGGYELSKNWKTRTAYSFIRYECHQPRGVNPYFWDGGVARNQFYLWLSGDLGNHWFLDVIGRYVDNMGPPYVPGYLVGDVRLAYRPNPKLEYAVVGRNLLDRSHVEADYWDPFGVYTSEVEQEVYCSVTCRF